MSINKTEPLVIPKPRVKPTPGRKVKPQKGSPWTVPAPYPKHYPQPTPKAWILVVLVINFLIYL
jgi:hypothetical protein